MCAGKMAQIAKINVPQKSQDGCLTISLLSANLEALLKCCGEKHVEHQPEVQEAQRSPPLGLAEGGLNAR